MKEPKKHLSFSALSHVLSKHFENLPDTRQAAKTDYSLHDILMSAFAMMYFQDTSLLAFQRRMQDSLQQNNLKSFFAVESIPKDTQLRTVIDQLPTEQLKPLFPKILSALQRGKQLEKYQSLGDHYLVALDGSQYFSSDSIQCPACLTKKSKKGDLHYHHQILQAVIIKPGLKQVIPFSPEGIQNSDGQKKQDCEINAAKRALQMIRKQHPKLKMIIVADGLYSKQPFVDLLKEQGMSFILVAKPDDHKILFQWVLELTGLNAGSSLTITDKKGRTHLYQWVTDVPLNGTANADQINFFQYQIREGNDKIVYQNSWVTDLPVSKNNIAEMVQAGRARWKIENETFNTLKNQGYHIEHNFGHGKKNLSMNFFALNLLAFFIHQILDLCDPIYQRCRSKFTSRKDYWNQLRCTFRVL
ncbi:MAG: transposase family protein, partial [Candidatus Omnitrophota bacterium]|nr:transposase family protein [Candidatus Omnitrophota bacterium]